ncbi:MAG: signal recognition particle-docking protein FtsY [Alphaproteobacteria bacterium]
MASWWQRLKGGLARSSQALTQNVSAIFTKRKLDDAALEELEDALIQADMGVEMAQTLAARLKQDRFGKDVTDVEVKEALAGYIAQILTPVAAPLVPEGAAPFVVLVAGVNGTGKTTTIGKLAALWAGEGKRVGVAAGDTFRAAAVEQLEIWADRAGARFFKAATGADAAGLAYDALAAARREGLDVLMIDTAGRLHNKSALMDELKKINRVLKKQDAAAPHASLLVLDATTGQNAHRQVEIFKEAVDVTGLVVTKLDGSARGGVVVALADAFGLPVHAVGVGEGIEDLRPFEAKGFARALLDLEPA